MEILAQPVVVGNEAMEVPGLEAMITKAFRNHPDADVLLPLALLEVSTDESHRASLGALQEDPTAFREYAFRMVSALDDRFGLSPPPARDGSRWWVPSDVDSVDVQPSTQHDGSLPSDGVGSVTSVIATALAEQDAENAASSSPVPNGSEMRKAYLQLARHYHPDKGGDHEMFVALRSAYELLQDPSEPGSSTKAHPSFDTEAEKEVE